MDKVRAEGPAVKPPWPSHTPHTPPDRHDEFGPEGGDPPEREDAVATFARLVDACRRRDVKATIGLKRSLRELGYRVEPCAAREGVGRG